MNRKTMTFGSGAVTPEKDKGRDAYHRDTTPNENQPTDLVTTSAHLTPPERIAALIAIRDRHAGIGCATQRGRLLEALETLGHVTTFEGTRYLDLYDVRARKLELVNAGRAIVTTWRVVQTESGDKHRIGVYALSRSEP